MSWKVDGPALAGGEGPMPPSGIATVRKRPAPFRNIVRSKECGQASRSAHSAPCCGRLANRPEEDESADRSSIRRSAKRLEIDRNPHGMDTHQTQRRRQ
jgi:hypothetical protein